MVPVSDKQLGDPISGFDEPIRVLLMVYSLNGAGGTERQVAELAKGMDRTRFEPHIAAVILGEKRGAELRESGVTTLQLPLRSFLSPSFAQSLRVLREFVRTRSIEIVHAFDPTMAILGCAARRYADIPSLLSSQRAYRNLSSRAYRPLLRLCDRMVDGVVVNCEAMRRHLIEDEHTPKTKVHVCLNSINAQRFCAHPRSPQAQPVTIGAICVLRAEKDLACLLKAFAALQTVQPQVTLLIVGRGPEKASLVKLSKRLGISDQCRFVDFQEKVEDYFSQIDIFVLPSLSEALSNSLMEAMACGCCVVGSRVGGTPELIEDSRTGLLFEPGDVAGLAHRLDYLVRNPDMRRRLAESGTRYIRQRFSRLRTISRMEQIYDDVRRRRLAAGRN